MRIKNTPTIEYLSETIFKNFVTFYEDKVVLKDFCPKEVAIAFFSMLPSHIRVIYEMSNPVCDCGHKLDKHAIVDWNMDLKYLIFKYRYICPECGKTIITPLKGIVDKSCNYTIDTKNFVVNIYSNEHISYANTSNLINDNYAFNISRQSTFNFNKKTDDLLTKKEEIIEEKIKEKNIDFTGFPGHDEAFLKVNGEKYTLLAMLDSNNQRIINDQLIPEKDYRDFLEIFIIYSLKDLSVYKDPNTPNPPHSLLLPDLKKDTLIGDGLKEYPNIAKKANMGFHPCVLHKIMNQRKPSWRKQKSLKRQIKNNEKQIEKNNQKIAEYYKKYKGQRKKIGNTDKKRRREKDKVTQMEKENKKLTTENKRLQNECDEYECYDKRISAIFDQETIKNAKRRFNILNNQIEHLPDVIAKAVRSIEKDLDSSLAHIENENIPKTNNWLELFFEIIFPKRYRNRFKTLEGVIRFLRKGKIKWYENVVLKEKIIVEKDDIWTRFKNEASSFYDEIKIHKNNINEM